MTRIPDKTLLEDLERIKNHPDCDNDIPNPNDVRRHGNHSDETYRNHFGSWRDVEKAFKQYQNGTFEPADPPDKQPHQILKEHAQNE